MRSTDSSQTKSLDSAAVCLIIEACAKYGVTTLKFSNLEFTRAPHGPQDQVSPGPNDTALPLAPVAAMTEAKPNDKPIPSEPWEQTELEFREEQIAELQLTDPLRAEELIERGELTDADELGGDEEQ